METKNNNNETVSSTYEIHNNKLFLKILNENYSFRKQLRKHFYHYKFIGILMLVMHIDKVTPKSLQNFKKVYS